MQFNGILIRRHDLLLEREFYFSLLCAFFKAWFPEYENMLNMKTFSYWWTIGEHLDAFMEPNNSMDKYTVATFQKGKKQVIGHLP